jgi:hypothetical protein
VFQRAVFYHAKGEKSNNDIISSPRGGCCPRCP